MATLILTLPRTGLQAGTALDYVLSPDGKSLGMASSAPLGLLPGATAGKTTDRVTDTVLLVGAAQLSWHRVQLPKGVSGNSARLRQVLEGLLEDQLLDEPAALHFALEPGAAKETTAWVAVCDKAWLRSGLQALEAAGVTVARIVPELVPGAAPDAEQLTAIENGGQALLLHVSASGVTPWPLQASTVGRLHWPADAPLRAEPAVAALTEQLFGRSVVLQSRAERALEAGQSDWDLAQLDLVNNQRSRSLKRLGVMGRELLQAPRWRAARWSVLALVVINLVGLNVRAGAERTALQAQRKAIDTVLTSTFPGTQVVVDAPVQMQRAVAALQQNAGALGGSDFETLLGAWARTAPTAAAPTGMDFANGELRLQGVSLPAPALAEATQSLKAQGYTLNTTPNGLILKGGL
ncbi:MAG: type II secretion system protein GspL [Rhodoferax sp.]|nr:type II secretion system protein GspL [Rhodoferax sp.]